jgi:hypothetical protein
MLSISLILCSILNLLNINPTDPNTKKEVIIFMVDSVLLSSYKYNPSKVYISNKALSPKHICLYDQKTQSIIQETTTEKEFKEVLNSIKKPQLQLYQKNQLINNQIQIIDSSLFNEYTITSKRSPLYSLSNPIFFNDNTICIIAYADIQGGGATLILQKNNKGWYVYKVLCEMYV